MPITRTRVRVKPKLNNKPTSKTPVLAKSANGERHPKLRTELIGWADNHEDVLAAQRAERANASTAKAYMQANEIERYSVALKNGKIVDAVNEEVVGEVSVIDVAKLRKLVTDELFMTIISATVDAVTEHAGGAIAKRCRITKKTKSQSFKIGYRPKNQTV